MIETEHLSTAMDYLFEEKKDWFESFKLLKENAKIYNIESLFLYHLIRKQIDIKDFESVFKEIVNSSQAWELKQCYNDFFNSSVTLGIEKYLNEDRYDNEFSDSQNMRYIFITKKNNKIALEPTSMEYLKVMFSHNINALVDSGIAPFFYDLTPNLATLKPILEVLQNAPDGKRVLIPLFYAISSMSYELPESVNQSSYKVLVETIPNIQKEFEDNLVYHKSHPEPGIEIDPSLMNFLNISQADVTKMINNRYQQEYENLLKTPVDLSAIIPIFHAHHRQEPFVKLAISISASIEMGYKPNTPLDLSQIDTNDSALKNFVYLKTLETKLKSNEPVKAPLQLCDYISEIYQKEKKSILPSLTSFLDLEMMSTKILYSRLDVNLEAKNSTVRKPKI